MLTLMVVLESSGYSSTFNPLVSAYSVTPSMLMTFLGRTVGAFVVWASGATAAGAARAGSVTSTHWAASNSATGKCRSACDRQLRLIRPPEGTAPVLVEYTRLAGCSGCATNARNEQDQHQY